MSIFNSVLGSFSKLRSSFEDLHAPEHELPMYSSSPSSPGIPPPIASTVLHPFHGAFTLGPRDSLELMGLQRQAQYLEKQLQELLDAQSDGLSRMDSTDTPAESDATIEDFESDGSPMVAGSLLIDPERERERHGAKRKKIGLKPARRGIYARVQQLAHVKEEELEILEQDLRELETYLQQTDRWTKKRSDLQKYIQDIQAEHSDERTTALHIKASKIDREIEQKEEELRQLKARRRKINADIKESENSVDAKLSSYKGALHYLEKDVAEFLARPPAPKNVGLSSPPPFLSLPAKRRTLDMAHDYWQDEHMRLTERCAEVEKNRSALDQGAVLWKDVVKQVQQFEVGLQRRVKQGDTDVSGLITEMDRTIEFLEKKHEVVTSKGWNLLIVAIGAELEAFRQGKTILEKTMKSTGKGKEKAHLVDTEDPTHAAEDKEEDAASPAFRAARSPLSTSNSTIHKPRFLDTENEDPDPELMISHHDTDTD